MEMSFFFFFGNALSSLISEELSEGNTSKYEKKGTHWPALTTTSSGLPYLRLAYKKFRPFLPLGTFVPVIEGSFIRCPAALLVAVPEGRQADTLFQVCHPIHS